MGALLWLGMAVGLACGLAHAVYVFNCINREAALVAPGNPDRPECLIYAIWTLALWLLFGLYVTVLWVVACCFYIPSRLLGRPSTILPCVLSRLTGQAASTRCPQRQQVRTDQTIFLRFAASPSSVQELPDWRPPAFCWHRGSTARFSNADPRSAASGQTAISNSASRCSASFTSFPIGRCRSTRPISRRGLSFRSTSQAMPVISGCCRTSASIVPCSR